MLTLDLPTCLALNTCPSLPEGRRQPRDNGITLHGGQVTPWPGELPKGEDNDFGRVTGSGIAVGPGGRIPSAEIAVQRVRRSWQHFRDGTVGPQVLLSSCLCTSVSQCFVGRLSSVL